MKKILLTLLLASASLSAENFYVSAGGSFSNIDDYLIECRASGVIAGGLTINESLNVEARVAQGFAGDYRAFSAYLKPKYENFYALVGVKHQEVDGVTNDDYALGVGFQINAISFDVEYSNETVYSTLLYTYRF